MCEIAIILKRDDKTYKEKFLCYDSIHLQLNELDPVLESYIVEAKKNMLGEPDEVTIKISISI